MTDLRHDTPVGTLGNGGQAEAPKWQWGGDPQAQALANPSNAAGLEAPAPMDLYVAPPVSATIVREGFIRRHRTAIALGAAGSLLATGAVITAYGLTESDKASALAGTTKPNTNNGKTNPVNNKGNQGPKAGGHEHGGNGVSIILNPAYTNVYPATATTEQQTVAVTGPISQEMFDTMNNLDDQLIVSQNGLAEFYQELGNVGPYTQDLADANTEAVYSRLHELSQMLGDKPPFTDPEYARSVLFGGKDTPQAASEAELQTAVANGDLTAVSEFTRDALGMYTEDRAATALTVYINELIKTKGNVSPQSKDFLVNYVNANQVSSNEELAADPNSPVAKFNNLSGAQDALYKSDPAGYKASHEDQAVTPVRTQILSAEVLNGQRTYGFSTADLLVDMQQIGLNGEMTESLKVVVVDFVNVPGNDGSKAVVGMVRMESQPLTPQAIKALTSSH